MSNLLGTGNIYTDGIQFVKKQLIVDPANENGISDGKLTIWGDSINGGVVAPFMLLYLDNTDIYLIHKDEGHYNPTDIYTVEGDTIPNSTVFISHFTDELSISNLIYNKITDEGQVLSATSSWPTEEEDGGHFVFEGVRGLEYPVYVWTKCDPKFASVAKLDCEITPGFSSVDVTGYFIHKTVLEEKHFCSKCNQTGVRSIDGALHHCLYCDGSGIPKLDRLQLTIAGLCEKDAEESGNSIQASVMPEYWICQNCQGTGKIKTEDTVECPKCAGSGFFENVIYTYNDESTNKKKSGCAYCGGNSNEVMGSGRVPVYIQCGVCNGTGVTTIPSELTYEQMSFIASKDNRLGFDTPGDNYFDENDQVYRNFSVHIDRTEDNTTKPYLIWQYTPNADAVITNLKITKIADETESEPTTPPCLGKGTLITMQDGTKKPIEEIQIGEYVLDCNNEPNKVIYVSRNRFADYHTLYYFDNGTVIDEVNKHRFYNIEQDFYQLLKFWKIGEHGISENGEQIALINKEIVEESAEAFGLYTKQGNYYANGLLSGQAFCNKRFIADMSASKAVDMLISIDNEANLFKLFEDKGALV